MKINQEQSWAYIIIDSSLGTKFIVEKHPSKRKKKNDSLEKIRYYQYIKKQ